MKNNKSSKNIFLTLLIFIIISCAVSSCSSEKEEIILPPKRIATGSEFHYYFPHYDLDQVIDESVAIAHIEIGNWIEEYCGDSGLGYTIFEANVIETYKGVLPDNIRFVQDGNSKCSLSGWPLFTHGNQLFVFADYNENLNAYSLLYAYLGYDVITDKDGQAYVCENHINKLFQDYIGANVKDYTAEYGFADELMEQKILKDPYWEGTYRKFIGAYKLEEMGEFIQKKCTLDT